VSGKGGGQVESAERRRRFGQGDRIVVIANPATRAEVKSIYQTLMNRLPLGVHLEIQETEKGGDPRALALRLRQNATGMIALGGDGTVSAVAAALHGTDIPLGIIPGGSTNIIAQELGVPAGLDDAVSLLLGEFDVRQIDVGVCNNHYFLHMAGAGFDSRLFDMADPALKKRIGWGAYIPAAIKALRDPARTYTLTVDGERMWVDSPLVLVANGSSVINSRIRINREIRTDDGELDLLVVTATKPHELASLIARFASVSLEASPYEFASVIGRLTSLPLEASPYVIHRRARTITIASKEPIPVQLDGDVVDKTPATFSVLPRDIGVIVPRESLSER
jgi:diacylglycerol kinase (ATP)